MFCAMLQAFLHFPNFLMLFFYEHCIPLYLTANHQPTAASARVAPRGVSQYLEACEETGVIPVLGRAANLAELN